MTGDPPHPAVRREAGLAAYGLALLLVLGVAGCGPEERSPDPTGPLFGGRVAVVAGTGGVATLLVIGPDGTETTLALPAPFGASVAGGGRDASDGAGGSRLAAVRADGTLMIASGDGAGGGWRPVDLDASGDPPPGRPIGLAVSADGRLAILVADAETTASATLRIADADTGGTVDVPLELVEGSPPAWLDADRVVVLTRDAADRTGILVVDTRTLATAAVAVESEGVAAGNGTIVLVADDRRSATEWTAGPDGLPSIQGRPDARIEAPGPEVFAERVALDRSGGQLATTWTDADGRPMLLTVHVRTDAGWIPVLSRPLPADGPPPLVTWLP